MKINITTDGVTLSPDVKEYVEQKTAHLKRFGALLGDAAVHIVLARTSQHHKTGEDAYKAELTLSAAGRDFTVSALGSDIFSAIDKLKDELTRTLLSAKGKEASLTRKAASAVKKIIKGQQQ